MVDYRKCFKVKDVTCDITNDILPFIKQVKNGCGGEIRLYDSSNLILRLSKGVPWKDGAYISYNNCNETYLILEVNSDYLPLDLEHDFNVSKILETVAVDTMYSTYLNLECNEYDFETYCNKIRFIIYTLYISLSADYIIETLLSKVKVIEKEIGKLRKDD